MIYNDIVAANLLLPLKLSIVTHGMPQMLS